MESLKIIFGFHSTIKFMQKSVIVQKWVEHTNTIDNQEFLRKYLSSKRSVNQMPH